MRERQEERSAGAVPPSWDVEAAAKALHADASPKRHLLYGEGVSLLVGARTDPGRLDLYPERLLARLRSSSLRLDVANVSAVGASSGAVKIESVDERVRTILFLSSDGSLMLNCRLNTGERQSAPPPEPTAVEVEPVSPPKSEEPEERKPERVVFTGRIGRQPSPRTTAKGRLIVKVPLAVHEGEKTSWHTVLFFDEVAKKAADTISKGAIVTVVGYKHLKEVPRRGGGTRQIEEVYAASLQLPKSSQTAS